MVKSKVLSVRLSLEALQSCFDLCEALGTPTNGASGAISRTLEVLTKDLRSKQTLPTYSPVELEALVASFISSKNPTSMASLSKLSIFDNFQANQHVSMTNTDFAPPTSVYQAQREQQDELEEYNEILEEQLRAQMLLEDAELLKKIMIGT
jgi:hypothetical protein